MDVIETVKKCWGYLTYEDADNFEEYNNMQFDCVSWISWDHVAQDNEDLNVGNLKLAHTNQSITKYFLRGEMHILGRDQRLYVIRARNVNLCIFREMDEGVNFS